MLIIVLGTSLLQHHSSKNFSILLVWHQINVQYKIEGAKTKEKGSTLGDIQAIPNILSYTPAVSPALTAQLSQEDFV